MPSSIHAVCWDSCVIIDCLQQHAGKYPDIRPMLEQAERGELRIVVSEISVAEVVKLDKLTPAGISREDQVSKVAEWFDYSYVIPRVVDRAVSSLAARIKRQHGVKTCDAVVLATAIRHAVPTVYTYDGTGKSNGLLSLDGKITMRGEGKRFLEIVTPRGRADGQTSIPI